MYEQGPIRPPSEASSLLVRVTRNCPWNRCLICPAYKGAEFSIRSVDEIKKDIDNMAKGYGNYAKSVTSAFLQDADSLILPTKDLVAILEHIRKKFPAVERVTTYARAKSMKRKSVESYKILKQAGLTRIHTGMESGSQKVLKLIRKGSSPEEMLVGGLRVKEAGISLSEYIMPGVGGRELSHEHAVETARILNEIEPDFIRVRTFAMPPASPMQDMVKAGKFTPMGDDEIVAEIRLLLTNLKEMHSHFRCGDFSLNLLMKVDGYLDEKKDEMLEEVDKFLALSKEKKQAFILLQRSNPHVVLSPDDIKDREVPEIIRERIAELEKKGENGFNDYVRGLMTYQLPQPMTEQWK
jgi:radical SAM superfamily enzyme YgiQ (UPF0313 family)